MMKMRKIYELQIECDKLKDINNDLLVALKLAVKCLEYCRAHHPDAQSGTGFPVEVELHATIAKAVSMIESSLSRHLWFQLTDYNGFDQKFFTPGSAVDMMYNIIETDRLRGIYRIWRLWTWEHFEEGEYHRDVLRDVEKFTSHIPFLVRLQQIMRWRKS